MNRDKSVRKRLFDDPELGTSAQNKRSRNVQDEQIQEWTNKGRDRSANSPNTGKKLLILANRKSKVTAKLCKRKDESMKNSIKTNSNGNNNNAVPSGGVPMPQTRSSLLDNMTGKNKNKTKKVDPIIRTRGMKLKELNQSQSRSMSGDEITCLLAIDDLNDAEITAAEEICHDGVELTILGSELDDEFPDEHHEPGELSDSDDDDADSDDRQMVLSKVVKVDKVINKRIPKRSDKFAHLRHDPEFKEFLNEVLDERMSARTPQINEKSKGNNTPIVSGVSNTVTPAAVENEHINVKSPKTNAIKSPSDTTIYSPALRRASNEDVSLMEKISNFVESIRLDHHRKDNRKDRMSGQGMQSTSADTRWIERRRDRSTTDDSVDSHQSGPECITDQLLVQAEKFKAKVEAPKGNHNFNDILMPYDYEKLCSKFVKPEGLAPIDSEILFLRNFDQDDEFFHITSQIEPSLRAKIERGEFIELERLLPKDRSSRGDDLNKQLFQLITQGTNTYLDPPVNKTGKISNIRKWDQAFRVYAAIYTHANPE